MKNAAEILTARLAVNEEGRKYSLAEARPLLVHEGIGHSALEIFVRASFYSALLRSINIRAGDRVAVLLDKTFDCASVIFGIWLVDGAVVPIFPELKGRQIRHILQDSGSITLFTNSLKLGNLASDVTAGLRVFICDQLDFSSSREPGQELGYDAEPGNGPETLAAIFYTSGSTGPAKGVAVSHGNLLAGTRIVSRYLALTGEDRILSVLPWSFDYGFNQLLTAFSVQGQLVIAASVLPGDICQALGDHRITGLAGVPTLWQQLVHEKSAFMQGRYPDLRYVTNSGGALASFVVKRLHERLPHAEIYLMYGLTEAFRSTYLDPSHALRLTNSIGRAIPETEILVFNKKGDPCRPGEVGELIHAGPTVALGYWNNAEATERRFKVHPLRPGSNERVVYSGDLVSTDNDGFLYFVGRDDEMLKSHGQRVSPTEIEAVILASNCILETIVRGERQPSGESGIVAHCVPKDPSSFSSITLLNFCRSELPLFMVPQKIIVHASLPKTSTGKLDRTAPLA